MKHDEKWGLKLAWSGIGLIVAGCLLGFLSFLSETFGWDGVPYYVVKAVLCVIYIVAIYNVIRIFFRKKEQ